MAALARGDFRQATMGLTINSNFNEEGSVANFWYKVEKGRVGVKAVTVKEAVRAAMAGNGET